MDKAQINIRPIDSNDIPYVVSTWIHSFQSSATVHKRYGKDIQTYEKEWRPFIEDLLSISQCNVATAPDDPSTILGYIVFMPLTAELHYCYVRHSLQHFGIATQLLEGFNLNEWTATSGTIDSLKVFKYLDDQSKPTPRYVQISPIKD